MPINNPYQATGAQIQGPQPGSFWNPQAPVNHFDTSTGRAGQNALDLQGLNLFDPETIQQLQTMLGPLFGQQNQNLTRNFMGTRNALVSEAGQNAGAQAAFKGHDPSSFVGNAQSRANSSLTPGYFQAMGGQQEDQLQTLINSIMGSSQFKADNLQGAAGINSGLANLFQQRDQFSEQMDNQPEWYDYAIAGLTGGIGGLLGGIGGGLGNAWGGGGSSGNGDHY